MSDKSKRPVSVGLASLFAVLVTLCLVIFAVLSRLTAQSELALAERAAEHFSQVYASEYRGVVYGETAQETQPSPPPGMDVLLPGQLPW